MDPELVESPTTETAFPLTVTGASISNPDNGSASLITTGPDAGNSYHLEHLGFAAFELGVVCEVFGLDRSEQGTYGALEWDWTEQAPPYVTGNEPRDLDVSFDTAWRAVHKTLLESFAEHHSASVQHTLHAMGQAGERAERLSNVFESQTQRIDNGNCSSCILGVVRALQAWPITLRTHILAED